MRGEIADYQHLGQLRTTIRKSLILRGFLFLTLPSSYLLFIVIPAIFVPYFNRKTNFPIFLSKVA